MDQTPAMGEPALLPGGGRREQLPPAASSPGRGAPGRRRRAVRRQRQRWKNPGRTAPRAGCSAGPARADVHGVYALSDRTVIVRGVLRETVVTKVDPNLAGRGPGTYYAVVDPATGELARTALADPVVHGAATEALEVHVVGLAAGPWPR